MQPRKPLSPGARPVYWLPLMEKLIEFGGVLASLLILLVLGITAYAILQRYLLEQPVLWADEVSGYLLVAAVMCGAAEALRRGDHIAIHLLGSRLPARVRFMLALSGNLAVVLLALITGWSALHAIQFARDFGSYSSGYLEVATWIPMLPMLPGMLLLVLAALVRSIRLYREEVLT